MYRHPARPRATLRSLIVALSATGATVAAATGVDAQVVTFRGIVVADSTGTPLGDVTVTVLKEDRSVAAPPVRTDSGGRFISQVPGAGWYRLKANRLGYKEVITPSFKTLPGVVTELELVMSVRVQLLAPLSITARYTARDLMDPLSDFDFRRRTGAGKYFTAKDIEERGAFKVTDMLRGVAGVRVNDSGGVASVSMARSIGGISGSGCTPPVFLDGLKLMLDPMELINSIPMEAITGIEIYKGPSTVPGEFMDGAACGAIVVWTRRSFVGPPPGQAKPPPLE
jgi:outer membrane receptor protein involved in Fe transport